ncbi:hypothetical protein JCM10212_003681 [Sporobolomyces blumeae]
MSPNTGSSAPAASGSTREEVTNVVGNTTAPAGSANPAVGNGLPKETLSAKLGYTMPADTKIVDTEREGDHVVPNSDKSGTAGPGGDVVHKETQAHDVTGMKGRLERDDERADRESAGWKEPVLGDRKPAEA